MSDAPTPSETIDLAQTDLVSVNVRLRTSDDQSASYDLLSATGQSNLACGIRSPIKVNVKGNCGLFFGLLNDGAEIDVEGDVGPACGHSMTGGGILVRGHAGHSLAAFARGGFIGVHGTARERCGLYLDGADVVVRQVAGREAGYGMRSGNLVLGNDTAEGLGRGATGGTIYLRGAAASVAPSLREVRMKDSDSMRLSLLLVRAGIRAATKDFRIFRPRKGGEE
ncbi:MAG: hypothetical protein U0892_22485 [Pirellulales bacterium]